MTKLFTIEGFCKGETHLSVYTDKGHHWINRQVFEAWVDRTDRRESKDGLILAWEYYYLMLAKDAIYEYLVIRQGANIFDGIKEGIDKCVN